MSFTNELSNFNASMEVTELLMKTLENAARNLAARCISEVASRHGFDAEKEIQALGLENLSLIRKQMAKRTAVTKEKKPREPKKSKSAFPMPFFAENVNTDGCQGLAYNRGLFTQCTKNKCETGLYCKGCQTEADKNSSGKPDCGDVSSRLATGLYEFKDPKGRSPISYIKLITKLNITLEQVSEETGKTGKQIPDEHLVAVEKKLSGRGGRPKKISAVETDDLSTVISDIFSKINLNANDEEVIEEVVEEEEEVIELSDKPKKSPPSDTEKAEKAEKKRLLEVEKAEKAEKKAALEAEKAEKAEQKRLLEVEKAEKKAALEAEKIEQKRLLEVEKAEKKAALEADKAEKKRLLEVEKAEKKEKEKADRKSKRETEKGTQKSKKDDSDNEAEKSETVKEAEIPPPASAPPNNKVKVSRIQISGKSYLKTVDNVLYDPDTRDEVGIWDPETKTIKPLPEEEDEEEQEEEYDSN
jgi:hypothetical protein